jgi:hypothetical protein
MSSLESIQLFIKFYFHFSDHFYFCRYEDQKIEFFISRFNPDIYNAFDIKSYVIKNYPGGRENYNDLAEFQFLNYFNLKISEAFGTTVSAEFEKAMIKSILLNKKKSNIPVLIRFFAHVRGTQSDKLLSFENLDFAILAICCLYLFNKIEFKTTLQKIRSSSIENLTFSSKDLIFKFIFVKYLNNNTSSIKYLDNKENNILINYIISSEGPLVFDIFVTETFILLSSIKEVAISSNRSNSNFQFFTNEIFSKLSHKNIYFHTKYEANNFLLELSLMINFFQNKQSSLSLNLFNIYRKDSHIQIVLQNFNRNNFDIILISKYFLLLFSHLFPFLESILIKVETKFIENIGFYYLAMDFSKRVNTYKNSPLNIINNFIGKTSFISKYLLNRKYFSFRTEFLKNDEIQIFLKYFNWGEQPLFEIICEGISEFPKKDAWFSIFDKLRRYNKNIVLKNSPNNLIYVCKEKSEEIIMTIKDFQKKFPEIKFKLLLNMKEFNHKLVLLSINFSNFVIFKFHNFIFIKDGEINIIGYEINENKNSSEDNYWTLFQVLISNFKFDIYFIENERNYESFRIHVSYHVIEIYKLNYFYTSGDNKVADCGFFNREVNIIETLRELVIKNDLNSFINHFIKIFTRYSFEIIILEELFTNLQLFIQSLNRHFSFNSLYIFDLISIYPKFGKKRMYDQLKDFNFFKKIVILEQTYTQAKTHLKDNKQWKVYTNELINKYEGSPEFFPVKPNFYQLYHILAILKYNLTKLYYKKTIKKIIGELLVSSIKGLNYITREKDK